MAIGKYSKRVTTFLKGRSLQMFRFDCVDSECGESVKLKEIVNYYYRNNPPKGFKRPDYNNEHNQ